MTYSPVAVELYNFMVNEAKVHANRQYAQNAAHARLDTLAAEASVRIVTSAARSYEGGVPIFTCEQMLEAALMLHREDMKAVEEDKRNASGASAPLGKGEL